MAEKGRLDQFANLAMITTTESAANTLTFKKLETGISLNEKVAWVINRIEYVISGVNATVFNAAGDILYWGLSVGNTWATISLTEPTIIDFNSVERFDIGTAASGGWIHRPIIKDFSTLPGGGIIVPPVPLYGYAVGSGLTAATTVIARLAYTLLQLSVDQYWELVEARRVLAS